MNIVSFFTENGVPKSGLTPQITIVNINTDTVVVSAQNMTALSNLANCYVYDFTTYDGSVEYAFYIDGGATLNNLDRYQFDVNEVDTTDLSDKLDTIQDSLDNIAVTGAAINSSADSFTLTTGTQVSGTYLSTVSLDGVRHQLADDTGELDSYYEFNVGGDGVPTSVKITGALTGLNDSLNVYAYNWESSTWSQIGNIAGAPTDVNQVYSFDLFTINVGTGSDSGKVRIRFYNTGLTSSNLYIDQIFVSYSVVYRSVGYALGAIWIDTNNGTSGSTSFINGTADNPVDNLTDALTLSGSIGITKFYVVSGSSITFTTSLDNYVFEGDNWNLDMNGQSISGSVIIGSNVSGICTGSTAPKFESCIIGNITIPPSKIFNSCFTGTITFGSEGNILCDRCHSGVAGTSAPKIDFGSGNNSSSLNMRHYSGGLEIENMGAGTGSYNMSIEGNGQLIINANCSATSTIAIRGNFTITDNSAGDITFSDDARFDNRQDIIDIKLKTDDLTFTTSKKVDARIDYVGDNSVSSPDNFKADLTSIENDISFIKDMEGGRWKIENNQMKFYKSDNTSLVATFNLYKDGSPSSDEPDERTRA